MTFDILESHYRRFLPIILQSVSSRYRERFISYQFTTYNKSLSRSATVLSIFIERGQYTCILKKKHREFAAPPQRMSQHHHSTENGFPHGRRHDSSQKETRTWYCPIDHVLVIGDWIVLAINSCLRLVAIFADKLPLHYPG